MSVLWWFLLVFCRTGMVLAIMFTFSCFTDWISIVFENSLLVVSSLDTLTTDYLLVG